MSGAKEFLFEEEARAKLKNGLDQLADAVCVTLGPKGKNVGYDTAWGAPTITNDGDSIAKNIELKDQYLNMGVSIGKEVARKMKESCGDGTTSALLLLRSMVSTGTKVIASGSSPILLKRGMEKALEALLQEIDRLATPVKGEKETANIATVSASGNEAIGKQIAEGIKRAGTQGVITIEEGKTTETTIDIVEGMEFERGYVSAYFATNQDSMTCEMHNAQILITDKKISTIHEILHLVQAVAAAGSELLIIADDIEGDALSTLVVNKLRGTIKVCAIKAPGFGDRRKSLLEDLAILSGGAVVSEERGTSLKEATVEILGRAEKVVVTKDKTTLIGGAGDATAIKARVKEIEAEIENTTNPYDKDKLLERKAKLVGGVAVIRVGAPTEPEMKQKKQMFEDSLNSTRAALEQGIVAGGGVALLQASKVLDKLKLSDEEQPGVQIVKTAAEAPFRQIVANAGFDPSLIIEQVIASAPNTGFNAQTGKVENLLQAGVVDPAKVVKNAMKYALSAAATLLLSEVLIGNAPENE
jgi:chaperonin GroEL